MAAGDVFLHREHFSVELARKLAGSGSFRSTLVKGVLGNWLLCMAVWQATAAQDVTGKLLAVMFPVSAYVTMVSCCRTVFESCMYAAVPDVALPLLSCQSVPLKHQAPFWPQAKVMAEQRASDAPLPNATKWGAIKAMCLLF